MRQSRGRAAQSGNIFIIILVAIALFTGLAMVVARSMQTSSVSVMSCLLYTSDAADE